MTRRRLDLARAAAAADGGKRVVLSCGSLDGAFLAALAKVRVIPAGSVPTSTWGPGVDQGQGAADAADAPG